MEIPSFTNDSFSSFGGLPGGDFLSGGQLGVSLFHQDPGDIIENPGGPLDDLDGMPILGSFSGGSQLGLFGDFDEILKLVKQILESVIESFQLSPELFENTEFSDASAYSGASEYPGDSGFDIDGDAVLPGEGGSGQESYSPIPDEKVHAANPGGDGSSEGYNSPAPDEKVPAANPDEKASSSDGSLTGPANGKYDPLIEKYAKEYGVDPDVIKAIMAKESQGNPRLVSPAGAAGLMQVKPETASELLGRRVTQEELLNDPELNIKVGVMYFSKMMKEKGSLEDALGAYNQGPNANWRSIPESIDYVDAIISSLKNGTLPTWG